MRFVNVHYSPRLQWVSAFKFCLFAIMPLGGLFHYLALRVWLAVIFSPIVLFSASLSLSQLGASLTEYELSESRIRKLVLGRVVGVMRYDDIEKVKYRENKWCYVKGNNQTFFFVPKMNGYEECLDFLGHKLKAMQEKSHSDAQDA